MTEDLYCEVCSCETGHWGVCYGCAMGVQDLREHVEDLLKVEHGLWIFRAYDNYYKLNHMELSMWSHDDPTWRRILDAEDMGDVIHYMSPDAEPVS